MKRTVKFLVCSLLLFVVAMPSRACWWSDYDDWYSYDYYDDYSYNDDYYDDYDDYSYDYYYDDYDYDYNDYSNDYYYGNDSYDFENYDIIYDYENYEDSYDDIYIDDHDDDNYAWDVLLDDVVITGNDDAFWNDAIFQIDNSWLSDGEDPNDYNDPPSNDVEPTDPPGTNEGDGGGGNDGGNNVDNTGVYDDIEDTSQYDFTLENILKWVMDKNDSFKNIVEKLQKEERIKEDSKDGICHYDPSDHSLHVPAEGGFGIENILHEIIHYIQEENGILNSNKCSADNEYQAYVLNYIVNKAFGEDISEPEGASATKEWGEFKYQIDNGVSVNNGKCTYTEDFLNDLQSLDHDKLSQSFRDFYECLNKENYYKYHDPDYNYNWEKMLNDLGFTKK